jgi:hypothetical protein
VERPETNYARSAELNIGYEVVGEGARDLVLLDGWFGNVDALCQLAAIRSPRWNAINRSRGISAGAEDHDIDWLALAP